ncbi:hypothetical protein [Jannaschia pohangensis]|uniref:Uncharacterized protein n=1 Tax=Jannaschia pohangensis TaxID=390807 RepID=A0A1I3Q7P4_9RHOB|nr:hypothetical protein [Jannaschia pohangensis]SFJ29908.1 hypothetical protein SAMN04488095_2447 [Jannaschia pohangensis]
MAQIDEHFLPRDVREGLANARARDRKKTGGRLRVHVGDDWYPITSYDDTGFEVALDIAPKLRGLVEIHEGPNLLRSVLIVAIEPEGDVMRYAFKRATAARTSAPLDYERVSEQPTAYLSAV